MASLPQKPSSRYQRIYRRTAGFAKEACATVNYLTSNEVYIYTSAIAFNVLVAIFPYLIVILTISNSYLPGLGVDLAITKVMESYLPAGEEFIVRNLLSLSNEWGSVTLFSAVITLMAGSGLFIPIEIAMNRALGKKNTRHYLVSSTMSFFLFLACGTVYFTATIFAAIPLQILEKIFGHISAPQLYHALSLLTAQVFTVPATCICFFLIYWVLPLAPRPSWRRLLPAAIAMGLLWEVAKFIYAVSLPLFKFQQFYGPFYITMSLIMWAFFSGFILLLGPHLVSRNILPVIGSGFLVRAKPQPTAPPHGPESAPPTH